jgi:hypothetical protein
VNMREIYSRDGGAEVLDPCRRRRFRTPLKAAAGRTPERSGTEIVDLDVNGQSRRGRRSVAV